MTTPYHWIFYDSFSKTQSNPIGVDEAQMAIFKMKPKDWPRFFVWTQGWTDWQSLELFLKSDQTVFITQFAAATFEHEITRKHDVSAETKTDSIAKRVLKEVKEITRSFSGVAFDDEPPSVEAALGKSSFDADQLSWAETEKPDINFKKLKDKMSFSKRDARHEFKIEVLLISPKGKTFRSNSSNISLSGSLLEDNIPFDYYGISFDVVIVNRSAQAEKNARVSLKAKTVGDGLTQRISFHDMTADQKRLLHGLLQDYLDEQQKLTRKTG